MVTLPSTRSIIMQVCKHQPSKRTPGGARADHLWRAAAVARCSLTAAGGAYLKPVCSLLASTVAARASLPTWT